MAAKNTNAGKSQFEKAAVGHFTFKDTTSIRNNATFLCSLKTRAPATSTSLIIKQQNMLTEPVATLVQQELCPGLLSSTGERRENHLAAIALNEVGSKLYASGKQDEAIEMFEAAAQVLKSQNASCPLLSQRLHWGCQRIKMPGNGIAQFQQHPPDTYLEGECDVGPRPLRQPLHLDAAACPEGDEFILEAMIIFNRALVHHSKSELDGAMENYSLALEILSNNSNVGHPSATLDRAAHLGMMLHNNMGQISYIEDDEENSVLHFESAVFWAKQIFGVSENQGYSLMLGTVLSNYCRTQWIHGNVDEETYGVFKTVLRLRFAALPADHVDVACAHYNVGIMAYARHLNDEAKTHFQKYLTIAKNMSDSTRLDPVPAMTFLLLIENSGKEDKLSVEMNRALHALQEKREEYGAAHMEVASLLNYIGTLLFHRKELRAAILFYREELRLEKTLMNAEAGISICVTYNNIGRILQELGELPEAIGCYRSALKADINENSYVLHAAAFAAGTTELPLPPEDAPASPSTTNLFSTIWYNLGLIHDKMGARHEAIMAFQMALGLRRKILGVDHPDIACLWYNIGTLQMEVNRLDDATSSFQEALRIRRLGKSRDDPRHIMTTLKKLACLQQTRGNIDDSIATLTEILQIQESSAFELQWKTPSAIGLTLRKIADLYEAKGDLTAALATAERSYLAFKSSGAFLQHNTVDHLKAVEEVARSLLMLGSLFNETCEPIKAQAAHEEARFVVAGAIHRLGGLPHPVLQPLLEASTLQKCFGCAPVA